VRVALIRRRWKGVAAVAVVLVAATGYYAARRRAPPASRDLTPQGGGWYTRYSSGHTLGRIALYRRGPGGAVVRVDDNIHLWGFYPPDCILYEPTRDAGRVYAACGDRVPVPITSYPFFMREMAYDASADGLRRIDTVRVVNGKAVATVARISLADIRKAAESQPPLFREWSVAAERPDALQPVVGDEPVDVHARGPRGTTPLIEAVRSRQPDVVDALLRQGAAVDARDSLGTTALQMAITAFKSNPAIVRRLLDAGADANVADVTGATPLMVAAVSNNAPVVRVLLKKGADPCRRDNKGKTVLDFTGDHNTDVRRMAQGAVARCNASTRERGRAQ
jgi:hypothetical protein